MTNSLRTLFSDAIKQYGSAICTIIGNDYNSGNAEITVSLLLNEKFDRVFVLLFPQEIQNIKDEVEVDSKRLYVVLLQKYLGLSENDLRKQSFSAYSLTPNAYHSQPTQDAIDSSLHDYFRHPWRLFNVQPCRNESNCKPPPSRSNQWIWPTTKQDSAPLFRRIFQCYLIAHMQEDLCQKNEFGLPLLPYADFLETLQRKLRESIRSELFALLPSRNERTLSGEGAGKRLWNYFKEGCLRFFTFSKELLQPLFPIRWRGSFRAAPRNSLEPFSFPGDVPKRHEAPLGIPTWPDRSILPLLARLRDLEHSCHLSSEKKQAFKNASLQIKRSTEATLSEARLQAERLIEAHEWGSLSPTP